MLLQSQMDKFTREIVLKTVTNSATATGTITAGSIAIGSPVILETNTASLPTTAANSTAPFWPSTNIQNFVTRPATSTAIVNNLLQGILYSAPRTDYLDREQTGLVQCHGPYVGAIVQIPPSSQAIAAGNVLLPESLQMLILGTGPVTAASTSTSAHTEEPAIGGLIIAMAAVASSAATATTTSTVFIRCM
jgi:hypothetical protein